VVFEFSGNALPAP
ncbi:hypothetical protein VCHC59A1_0305B, partial [Vibrio cholerae HC-59A1]